MSSNSHENIINNYANKTELLLQDMPDSVMDFINEIADDTSERTQYEYTLDIRTFLYYVASGKPLMDITTQMLDALSEDDFDHYFDSLSHYKENDKDIYNGPASIKRKMAAVRNFMNYLYKNHLITEMNILKIPVPKIQENPAIVLSQTEINTLLDFIQTGKGLSKKQQDYHKQLSARDTAIVCLLLSSGIRISECVELDVADVDFEEKDICIIRDDEEFYLEIPDKTLMYLKAYKQLRDKLPGIDTEPAFFVSTRKRRMCIRAIENMIRKYTRMVIPNKNITPHSLRATYAATLYETTGDIALVAENMGQKTIKATKNRYAGNILNNGNTSKT